MADSLSAVKLPFSTSVRILEAVRGEGVRILEAVRGGGVRMLERVMGEGGDDGIRGFRHALNSEL